MLADLKRIQLFLFLGMAGLWVACNELNEQRATELIRLKYRQQNTTAGGGQWLLDSIQVVNILKGPGDTFQVEAITNGLVQLPAPTPTSLYPNATFRDTLRFNAWKAQKVWVARNWVITGSSRN